MTTILPSARNAWDVIGSQIGENISQHLPGAVEKGYNRGQLQHSLDAIKNLANDPNATPLDIALGAMKAGAGIPGSERYMGAILPKLLEFSEARRSQKVPLVGEGTGGAGAMQAPGQMQPGQEAPPQETQENPFFPNNVGNQNVPGNMPQAETTGQKVPLLSQSQRIAAGKKRAEELSANGIPTTPKEGLAEVDQEEERKKLYNQKVDEDLANRVKSQATYGDRASAQLERVFPQATDEMKAIFAKKGEEAVAKEVSEADIDRYLAKEATKFKNTISSVKNTVSAPRFQNSIGRQFLGTYSDAKQASDDLRTHLKPILDLGLYDTARNLLADLGYYPEEREMTINPLDERSQALMNRAPQLGPKKLSLIQSTPQNLYPQGKENVKSVLRDLKEANPNFSLLLPRKYLEDKGYDWRLYKDALNELEAEGFQLTDDQRSQREKLDTPPLNNIERILHNVKLIGR